MKVRIEADSQEEFDLKRADLIKAIAGKRLKVEIKREKKPFFKAEDEMVQEWNGDFTAMITSLKKEVEQLIDVSI